ncbi:MAG: hypothetical protein CSA62_06120 [Planctomycetota bacterium]|nr:MAG: hypothetical protein CSA62_06120 [Planctomycetota bacterium]
MGDARQLGTSDPELSFPNDPEETEQVPFPDELIDQLLVKCEKPEDLTGKDGNAQGLTVRLPGPGRRADRRALNPAWVSN